MSKVDIENYTKNIGSRMNGGNSEYGRKESDFYPTPPDATNALMIFLKERGLLKTNYSYDKFLVLEPCCGDGAISNVLKGYDCYVDSYDIRQTGYGHGGVDFLTTDREFNQYDAVITNPPFLLAEEFILKSLKAADMVCMLLKSQYFHAKKRFKLFQENKPEYILPLTWRPDFTGQGGALMDCIWVVWSKDNHDPTKYQPLLKPITTHSA